MLCTEPAANLRPLPYYFFYIAGFEGFQPTAVCLFLPAHISEHPNQQPSHKIQITMGSTEARVDYMGSSILMGVFSNADLQLQDEWKVNLCTVDTSMSEKR